MSNILEKLKSLMLALIILAALSLPLLACDRERVDKSDESSDEIVLSDNKSAKTNTTDSVNNDDATSSSTSSETATTTNHSLPAHNANSNTSSSGTTENKSSNGGNSASTDSNNSKASVSHQKQSTKPDSSSKKKKGTAKANKPTSNSNSESSEAKKEKKKDNKKEKKWVEPVYKEVYHEEQGHYETIKVQKVKCACGQIFDSKGEQKAHQDAYIAEMRKTIPDFECQGDHVSKGYVTETYEEYVIDQEAYTEKVLVSEGHWE